MSFLKSDDDRDLLVGTVRAAVDKASVENPGVRPQLATVTTYAEDPDQALPTATVIVDGDAATNQQQIPSIAGQFLDAGDRVVVMFVPPHGAVVLNRVGYAKRVPACRLEWQDDVIGCPEC